MLSPTDQAGISPPGATDQLPPWPIHVQSPQSKTGKKAASLGALTAQCWVSYQAGEKEEPGTVGYW